MSISSALSNALSGLTAASVSAQIVSSNLANAMTDGFARRTLELSPRTSGSEGGVSIDGVVRHADQNLISDRRLADAELANTETASGFFQKLESLVGLPQDPNSLSARLNAFEASLIEAASRPDQINRLTAAAHAADSIAVTFNEISDGIQSLRTQADREIGITVERLNTALQQTRDLNLRIVSAFSSGRDTSALEDQRQLLIDEISRIVPIREVPREKGTVALFTPGGAVLLDGTAAELSFETSNLLAPHMTIQAGLVSGLSINGRPVGSGTTSGPLAGGSLSALFHIRDEFGPEAQAQLDAAARNFVERYQDPALDPTRLPGTTGLFTDGGSVFDASNEIGIAGRLALNDLVAVDGGDPWRLRAGLGATDPGASGNAALLQNWQTALSANVPPASGTFSPTSPGIPALIDDLTSQFGVSRNDSEQDMIFAQSRYSELNQMVLSDGVDSDQEMQRLMLIEQHYAANVRMVETIDEMMQTLLRI